VSGEQQAPAEDTPAVDDTNQADLRARLEVLREENRRLRAEHRRTLQARYRRSALGMAALGLVALGGAALFPGPREVLLALAGVGLFAGILVYYLTPERFIAASVGESVYDAYARTGDALAGDLGLTDRRVYVPAGEGVRLFVPQHESYEPPDEDDLDGAVVVTDEERTRGIAVSPTGGDLFVEFERTLAGEPSTEPSVLADQVADGVVEAFELADSASGDGEAGRLNVEVTGSVYSDVGDFDHPVASFVGVATAGTLDVPVELDVTEGEGQSDAVVTATWDADGNADSG
jgi:hypothetical protein